MAQQVISGPPVVNAGLIKSDQISYNQSPFEHPQYKMVSIPPQNFGQTINITTSPVSVKFTIPAEVFNWAQSYLLGTLTIAANAANYNWTFRDVGYGLISYIRAYNQNNAYYVDLNNAHLWV